MNIIAKLSFWIMPVKPFQEFITDGLAQFRREGYVEKLKNSITSESLPSNKGDLLDFLYNQIVHA